MELTITQALTKATGAHRDGNHEVAERLYNAILKIKPDHPDANHNLGILALSKNKNELAIKCFEAALKFNSHIEQFWLSYISALLASEKLAKANNAFRNAKDSGVDQKKLIALEKQLISLGHRDKAKNGFKDSGQSSLPKRSDLLQTHGKKHAKARKQMSNAPSQQAMDKIVDRTKKKMFDEAEKLSKLLTREFPTHHFAWKALGIVFKETGRKAEAVDANRRAVSLCPADVEAHTNLGITLRDLGEFTNAKKSYTQAIKLAPQHAPAHNGLGNALRALKKFEKAAVSYKRAISFEPNFAEPHNNWGIMLHELGRLNEAEERYKKALMIKPRYAEAHFNLARVLYDQGKLDGAVVSYERAIATKSDYVAAYSSLGKVLKEQAMLKEAIKNFRQAIALGDYQLKAQDELLTCLYLSSDRDGFYSELDRSLGRSKITATIGSLTQRSELRYGIKKPNLFCEESMKYVLHTDLKASYDFDEIFVKKVRTLLGNSRIPLRRQTLLVKGVQTSGNLFDTADYSIKKIEKVIRSEIIKYRDYYGSSKEGLISKWPDNYSLFGWLISIKTGGALRPHIHEEGWLSGSVYINVPKNLADDSGKLVVSLGEDTDATSTRKNIKKKIDVATGSIVLFPASLMHHTIPFESKEERIVLAFDVIPEI